MQQDHANPKTRKFEHRGTSAPRLIRRAAAICIALAIASGGYATTLDFHRWQFGEFAATLRYLLYGTPTPGINDLYAKEIQGFVKVSEVEMGFICPSETSGTLSGQWTFFGARFLPLPASKGMPSFYSVSYLGGAIGFHNGNNFDAFIGPEDILASLKTKKCISQLGLAQKHITTYGHEHLTRQGHYAPLSFNSLDIDGDLVGDFVFGGLLHASSTQLSPVGTPRIGMETVFIQTINGVRLVRMDKDVISVERYQDHRLHTEATVILEQIEGNSGHTLVVLPSGRKEEDLIGVRLDCGLAAFAYQAGAVSQVRCVTGLTGNWAMPGARADFDGDGIEDFWLSQTVQGDSNAPSASSVRLISGALWREASGLVPIDRITVATIKGSAKYSDYDGVATTLSPFAGDVDGDQKPDLTFSGHRHMNEAGALYVLPGRNLTRGLSISLDSPHIVKIAGNLMSQLAPPYHHWDASDWDADGCDDIVISADNDLFSGLNAGAVHVLSGKKIAQTAGLPNQCK